MLAVTRPRPMPSVIELPEPSSLPWVIQLYMAAPIGSAAAIRILGFCDLRYMAVPARVRPVPVGQVRRWLGPSVCSQVPGPVVSRWAGRLARFSHWLAYSTPFGVL